MTNQDLTKLINNRINQLKDKTNSLPTGGGFESLRVRLDGIQNDIKGFVLLLDEIEQA